METKDFRRLLPAASVAIGLLFTAPLWGTPTTAQPGTINYVEGRVLLDGQALNSHSVGSAELNAGQVLDTRQGKAEVLLTPGVFLRLSDNSEIRMENPGLTQTSVDVTRGEALLEVTMLMKENHLQINDAGVATTIEKDGLYRFTADNSPAVSVLAGQAEITKADRRITVKKDRQLLLADASTKPQKFDKASEDDLYAWSKLRSEYTAQANAANTQLVVAGGFPWYGPGWYWSPWYDMYAFMPGYAFMSPFGYPFYSPFYNPWYAGGGYFVGSRFYGGHNFYRGAVSQGSSAVIGHRLGTTAMGGGFRSGEHLAIMGGGRVGGGFGGGFHGGGFGGHR